MSNPFKSQKPPPPTPAAAIAPLPPPPARTDTETQALADEQRQKFAVSSGGRAKTYLTSGGTTDASSAVRFLGGAART